MAQIFCKARKQSGRKAYMPAASCRIMPARSISLCETISASFGVSRKIGRKKRDRRIAGGSESRTVGGPSESGSAGKTQGRRNARLFLDATLARNIPFVL